MPDLAERARALARLHRDPRILVLANVWDVLNARTDAYVLGDPGGDPDGTLREAIRRGRAYLDAGAPLVFVPRAARVDHIPHWWTPSDPDG